MFEWLKRKLKKEEDQGEESMTSSEEILESESSEEVQDPSQWEGHPLEQEALPEELEEPLLTEESQPFIESEFEELAADEDDVLIEGNEEEEELLKNEGPLEAVEPELFEAEGASEEDLTEGEGLEELLLSTQEKKEVFVEKEIAHPEETSYGESVEAEEASKEGLGTFEESDVTTSTEDVTVAPDEANVEPEKTSLFQRLKRGLTKTRDDVGHKINQVLGVYVKIDDEMMEDLEEVLVTSDIGVATTMEIVEALEEAITREKVRDPQEVKPLMKKVIIELMEEDAPDYSLHLDPSPAVILVIGVNGVGKTTTIGKLSHRLQREGKTVLVAAADTFRAAAIDQLKTWGQRAGVDVIAHTEGADPTAVVYDGIQAAKARGADVLICDTAGRLHNKKNLMQELEKINRIIDREYGEATRETLLVLDATTGQNAMIQAKTFTEAAEITGIVLTKLDGTAKGGVVIALQRELKIPIKLVGIGEGIDDLQPFDGQDFVEALF